MQVMYAAPPASHFEQRLGELRAKVTKPPRFEVDVEALLKRPCPIRKLLLNLPSLDL